MRIFVVILLMFFAAPVCCIAVCGDVAQVDNRRTIIHTVSQGETVSSILKSYNMSLGKFLKFNRSFEGTNLTLSLGQRLVINKKDMGSATDREIVLQVKSYLSTLRGASLAQTPRSEGAAGGSESRKAELINNNATSERRMSTGVNGTPYTSGNDMKVTLLLPLTKRDGSPDAEYVSFYKGALLAMNELKSDGLSMLVDVFDTGHTVDVIDDVLHQGILRGRNLVIGPIYKEQFAVVEQYMRGKPTVLVSPLAYVGATSANSFQLAPSLAHRYDKLKDFFVGKNIVYINSGSDDTAFYDGIRGYTSRGTNTSHLTSAVDEESLKSHLSSEVENIIVIGAKRQSDIESILSRVAAIRRSLSHSYRIGVLGSGEFSKIEDSKRADFFKSNTYYLSSYHQDRLDESSLSFETQYIEMFGEQPTIFSYRAYDAVMLFASALNEYGAEFYDYSNEQLMRILQVGYRFVRDGGGNVNHEWMLVNYRPDYTIVAK